MIWIPQFVRAENNVTGRHLPVVGRETSDFKSALTHSVLNHTGTFFSAALNISAPNLLQVLDLFLFFVFWFCTTSKVSVTFPLSSPLLSSSICLSRCSLLDSPCVRLFYGVNRSAQWDLVCVQIICLLGHFSWLPLWRPLNVENTKVWGRGRAFVCSHPPSSLWHLVGPVAAQRRRRR